MEDNLQNQIAQAGHAVLPGPMLNANQVEELSLYCFGDYSPREKNDATLAGLVHAHLLLQLPNFLKGRRRVAIHAASPATSAWQQLPCITDEAAHRAFRLWLPLEEAELTAIARSHRWSNALRGEGLPSIWRGLDAELEKLATKIQVKPGSAVLFDRALLHKLPEVAGITLDWVAEAAPLRCYAHDDTQPDAELIACFSYSTETEGGQGSLLGHLRQNLEPVRPQDLQALRMGILPAIHRPLQDPNLLQAIPKARPGFSKR